RRSRAVVRRARRAVPRVPRDDAAIPIAGANLGRPLRDLAKGLDPRRARDDEGAVRARRAEYRRPPLPRGDRWPLVVSERGDRHPCGGRPGTPAPPTRRTRRARARRTLAANDPEKPRRRRTYSATSRPRDL